MPPTSSPFCSHYASYFYGKPMPCQRPAPKEARIDSAQRSYRIFFIQSRWKIEHRAACSVDEFPPKYGQKRCAQTTMPNRSVTPYTYVFNNSLTERKRTVNIRKLFSTYTIIISVYYSFFAIYTWLKDTYLFSALATFEFSPASRRVFSSATGERPVVKAAKPPNLLFHSSINH